MAKQSLESLSVAAVSIPLRPDPPEDLNIYQKKVWNDVVSTKPPEWFESDCFPLLRAYCVAADYHKRLTDKIEDGPITGGDSYRTLNEIDKQARSLGLLAQKMRLTQQSRYTPQAAATANKKAAGGRKPWDA